MPPDQGSRDFQSLRAAMASPLATAIFKVEGVSGVFVGPDFIAVNITEGQSWSSIKPEVFAAITEFFASGLPVLHEKSEDASLQPGRDTAISDTDSEVVAMIKELIESRIRPAVQEDGGDILYRGFDEQSGKVSLQMQGSCVGCPSSALTLKSGIENMLKHYIPEVTGVEEYKDEVLESVSDETLKKLEGKLAKVHSGASS